MKHKLGCPDVSRETGLFADTEFAENNVQQILDIDPPCQSPQRMHRKPQLLGDQFIALPGHLFGPAQRRGSVAQ